MKALSPCGSGRQQPRRRLYRVASCLLLLAALFTLVQAAFTKPRPSWHGVIDTLPELDSFSEPAIAVAVLKLELDRVFQNHIQCRDGYYLYKSAAFDSAPRQADASLARLQELHQQIEELACDVDHKLMTAYLKEGLANDFVERYLDRLGARSEHFSVGLLAWTALLYAEQCQRTAELLHALQDFSALHPELKPSPILERTVHDWQTKTGRSPDVTSQ